MRCKIAHDGIRNIRYEIREIVDYGYALRRFGIPIHWENIGDPIAAGEQVAPWVKEIVLDIQRNDSAWAYCPSRGVLRTREFLADVISRRKGEAAVKATPDDVLFFNGIADAVDKIYDLIQRDCRVLMPSPSYPTHTSNEGKRGDYRHLQFPLDPKNNWLPDLAEIESIVRYNPQVVAIALVNPDNPTGAVYPRETLQGIIAIARKYGLFIICDEIYAHITYNGAETLHISQLLGDVPAISLRGISKDFPWPGSRCGWIEMLNRNASPEFSEYCDALVKSKMLEVCSTTLPQLAIPLVYGDKRYDALKTKRAKAFESRSNQIHEYFRDNIPGVVTHPTQGAFYFCVAFEDGLLDNAMTLPITDPTVRAFVEKSVEGVAPDKRFVHYMMAADGVCVTPLTGFHTDINGFRITTLAPDDAERAKILERIGRCIKEYARI